MPVKRNLAAAAVFTGAVLVSSVLMSGSAEARIPCGRSNQVGPQGATVFRTATGFTPTGKHIPGNTVIRDGAWVGDRVEAIGWGYIATTTLRVVDGATC